MIRFSTFPTPEGSQVLNDNIVVSEGINETVSVTILSHPYWLRCVVINMPASDDLQVLPVIKIASDGNRVIVSVTMLSQPY